MQIFNSLNDIKIEDSTICLLGKFDGMHKGHRKLFERARQLKIEENANIAVFTMSFPKKDNSVLNTEIEKLMYFDAEGVDYLIDCNFEEIKDIDAVDFILNIVLGKLHAEVLVAGPDCSFGKGKKGNVSIATKLMENAGKRMEVVEKAYIDNSNVISSSFIRECMKTNEFDKAIRMLSHSYLFMGEVVHGNHIGHRINFPTINMEVDDSKVLPAYGVYASYVTIGNKKYIGVSNIGVKPTVGSKKPLLETFVIDFDQNIYGKTIIVELFRFVRSEMKFADLSELRLQIAKDAENVKRIMNGRLI